MRQLTGASTTYTAAIGRTAEILYDILSLFARGYFVPF